MGDCRIADAGCPETTRARCFWCGEHVCTHPGCSRVMPTTRQYGKKRLCLDCVDSAARAGETWALEAMAAWQVDLQKDGGGWPASYLEDLNKAHDRSLKAQEERSSSKPPQDNKPQRREIPRGLPLYLHHNPHARPGQYLDVLVAEVDRGAARALVAAHDDDPELWLDPQRITIRTLGTSVYRQPRIVLLLVVGTP